MARISPLLRAGLWIALLGGGFLLVPDPTNPIALGVGLIFVLSAEIAIAGARTDEE